MASREQNLRINITGDNSDIAKAFKEVIAEAKKTESSVAKLTVKMDDFGEVTSRSVTLANGKLKELQNHLKGIEGADLTVTDNFEAQKAAKDREIAMKEKADARLLQQQLAAIKTKDAAKLEATRRTVKTEEAIITKGAKSIEAFRTKQRANREILDNALQRNLAAIRKRFEAGDITAEKQAKLRDARLREYKKNVLSVSRALDVANKKELAQQQLLKKQNADIIAAKRRQLSLERQRTSAVHRTTNGIKGAVRAHKNWTLQIAEGIGLYRAVSFAISSISRAILAIPKIGIERQTTEAVFEATLGGAIGSAAAFEAIAKEATRTGIAVNVLRETFRNLNASMTLAGESSKTAFEVFTNLNTVSTALHLSADKTSSVFAAIAQIFNKNKVQSEELVKQLGNLLPGAFASFQKANATMFKSTEDLIKQMSLGTVVAHDTVVNFTEFLAKRFQTGFDLATQGLQANLGRLQTSFIELGEAIFKVSKGPMTSIIIGMTDLANGIKGVIEGTSALTSILQGALFLGVSLIAGKVFTLVKAFLKVGISIKKTSALGGTLTKKVKFFSWANKSAKGIALLSGALTLLGGVPGLVIAGLTAITFAVSRVGKKARDAQVTILELIEAQAALSREVDKRPPTLEFALAEDTQIKAATQALKEKRKELEKLQQPRKTSTLFVRRKELEAEKEHIRDLKALIIQGELAVQEAKQRVTDQFETQQAENKINALLLVGQHNQKLIKTERATQIAEQQQASEHGKAKLRNLGRQLKNENVTTEFYLAEKQRILLADVNQRTAIARKEKNLIGESDIAGLAKADLKLTQLRLEAKEVKESLAQERLTIAARQTRQATKDIAYQQSLKASKAILLKLQGETLKGTLAEIEATEELSLARIKGNSIEERAAKSRIKLISQIQRENAKIADIVKENIEVENAYEAAVDAVNAKIKHSVQEEITANRILSNLRNNYIDQQTRVLEDLEKELLLNKDNVLLQEKILDQKLRITETRQGGAKIPSIDPDLEPPVDTGFVNTFLERQSAIELGREEELRAAKEHYTALYETDATAYVKHQEEKRKIEEKSSFESFKNNANLYGGIADLGATAFDGLTKDMIKMYGVESEQAKKSFLAYKAFAIAKAIISTAQAVTVALTGGPYIGVALAAVAAASGAIQVARIAAQPMPAAHGGLDYVPKEETYLLDKGERVLSPNQNRDFTSFMGDRKAGRGAEASGSNVSIVNVLDPSVFDSYLNSAEGEERIMNIVTTNQGDPINAL